MAQGNQPGDVAALLLKRWWVIAVGLALGVGLAIVALRVVPPTYSATAIQLIKGVPGTGVGANFQAAQYAVARARTYPAFINGTAVLEAVRSDLGPEYTDVQLRTQLTASNPPDTPLVQITATGRTAEEAQSLADSASRHLARFITQIETVGGATPVVVETAVQAGLPTRPTAPQPALFLGLGVSGGLAAGILAVFIWEYVSRRRRHESTDDLEPLASATEVAGARSHPAHHSTQPRRARRRRRLVASRRL